MNTKKVVLVIDDDPVMQVMIKTLLSETFDVITTSSVRDGIKIVMGQNIDLVLTDTDIPVDGEGFEMVRFCDLRGILVRIMSGKPLRTRSPENQKLVAGRHIDKPFSMSQLLFFLAEAFEEKELASA